MKLFEKMKQVRFARPARPNRRQVKTGAMATVTCVLVVAVVVAANAAFAALPVSLTRADLTSTGLYTLSDTTKTMLSGMEKDVTAYYIAQTGSEDSLVTGMLDRYAEAGDHFTWQQEDPVENPTFAHNYDDASEGSVVVTCGDKYQVLGLYDLYTYDYDYTTGASSQSFDGENQLTAALRYVTSDVTPIVYLLQGHQEASLSSSFTTALQNQNLTTETLNLVNTETVPEDAAAVMMVSPQKDLTAEETERLRGYLEGGGNLVLFTDLTDTEMPNLYALLDEYGMAPSGGLVVEGDSQHIYGRVPYQTLPDIQSSSLLSGVDQNGYVLMSSSTGIVIDTDVRSTLTVSSLLQTSDSAHSKPGWQNLTTWDKEDGDLAGPFSLGAWASETVDDTETNVVWFASSSLLNDEADLYMNGNNSAVVLSVLGSLCGQDVESTGIAAKSVDVEYLTLTTGQANLWSIITMYLLPAAAVAVGIAIVIKRRKA